MNEIKIAFIGAGKMASAMVEGVLKQHIFEKEQIACVCGNDDTGKILSEKTGIRHESEYNQLLTTGQIVVLACKPQSLGTLPAELESLTQDSLILSILAGVRLSSLSKRFPKARNLVRCMPNAPGQIGAGITAFAPLKTLDPTDLISVETFLSSLGVFLEIPEEHIDAVTAVSGSGPAYVFEFAIALREAAESAGLPENVAKKLAHETLFGAAKLMEQSSQSPEELKASVISAGGTTEAAFTAIEAEQVNLRRLLEKAVLAAKSRSIELSEVD